MYRKGNTLKVLLHFSQTCKFWSSKADWRLRFSLLSIILTDLLGNKTLLHGFKRSRFVICDWWISIHFVCFSVSRFIACDCNYDWWQRKTQFWRQLLNFRVRMFVKSARSQCAGIGYIHVVTTDCLMVHRIVILNLNWTEDYSSIVTVYKSKEKFPMMSKQ